MSRQRSIRTEIETSELKSRTEQSQPLTPCISNKGFVFNPKVIIFQQCSVNDGILLLILPLTAHTHQRYV